jgi:Putative Actinobacterial Holin-X, holin superfamily III
MGDAVKQVAEHASALMRLEIELAKLEVSRKAKAFGVGIALLVVALVLLLFMIGFALAAIAAALAGPLATWLAILIVAGGLLLVALTLAAVGIGSLKRGSPPVPQQAIEEAKLTSEAIKSGG